MMDGNRRGAGEEFDLGQDDEIPPRLWEEALRFALDLSHASARCGRRACRKAGACHLRWSEGERITCGGRAVDDEAIEAAGRVALFASLMRRGRDSR